MLSDKQHALLDYVSGAFISCVTPRTGLKLCGAVAACATLFLVRAWYNYRRWPGRTLPGPPMVGGLIWGSAASPLPIDWACIFLHEAWFNAYGHTLRIWGIMAVSMTIVLRLP